MCGLGEGCWCLAWLSTRISAGQGAGLPFTSGAGNEGSGTRSRAGRQWRSPELEVGGTGENCGGAWDD